MSELTNSEYWVEVKSIADNLVSEAMSDNENDKDRAEEDIFDSRLHETIDGHQWVIYYSYNLDVIKHSANEDYYSDNFGGEALEESLKGGLDTLHCHIAFWALYADVCDYISESFDSFEEAA